MVDNESDSMKAVGDGWARVLLHALLSVVLVAILAAGVGAVGLFVLAAKWLVSVCG